MPANVSINMKFEEFGLDEAILKGIQELGYKRPTDIQYKAIRPVLRGEDVLAIAQTGTGKTAAFAIPVLNKLLKGKRSTDGFVRCVVMVPTHELALQISEAFQSMARFTKLVVTAIYGGVDQAPQIARLQQGVDVLVATPGRLFDLVSQQHLKLDLVEVLILDEADHMLDMGFLKDIQDLIRYLPRKRQTLFFSATIDAIIKKLAYSLVTKPIRIQISPKNPVAKNITHSVIFIGMDEKRFFLERVVNENPESKILVFVRTKVRAERVHQAMLRVGINSVTMHSDKDQSDRLQSLNQFKQKEVRLLIATDVSARGIDIAGVDYVVNYDIPDVAENYVHRVGRTGRGTAKGIAVSFCSDEEKEWLERIEEYIGQPVAVIKLDSEDYETTIDFSKENKNDWRSLLKEEDALASQPNLKKRRKK